MPDKDTRSRLRLFACTGCGQMAKSEVVNLTGSPHDGCSGDGEHYWFEIPAEILLPADFDYAQEIEVEP